MPSPPTYQIIVFQTLSPSTTPETCHYAAGLLIGYDANPRWTCSGATADEAREKMAAFWEKERKSHEPRLAPKKKPASDIDGDEAHNEIPEVGIPTAPVDEDFDVV